MRRRYRRRGAATFVNAARDRVDLAEVEQRLAERDRRQAADTRTEAQTALTTHIDKLRELRGLKAIRSSLAARAQAMADFKAALERSRDPQV